jgi:hypothetical protein
MPRLRNLTAKAKKTFSFLTIQYGTYHMSEYHTDHGPCEIGKYEIGKAAKIFRTSILTMVKISVEDPDPESVPDPQDLAVFEPPESWIRIHKSEVRIRIRLLIIPFFSHKSVEKTEKSGSRIGSGSAGSGCFWAS